MTAVKLLAAIGAGLVAAELTARQEKALLLPVLDYLKTSDDSGGLVFDVSGWIPPEAAEPYLAIFHAAEDRHGLPENLLVRVAYQESRFRADIISGATVSSAGAQGIMQIVPRWHPNVDPLNVREAIEYAAKYLAYLRRQTGSWSQALAAYNWGIGNLTKYGFDNAPRETRDYVAQISEDVLRGYA